MATYRESGVDIDAGNAFVKGIQVMVRSTYGPEVVEFENGFGGLFELNNPASQLIGRGRKQPVLVACTDGVGSKLKISIEMDKHDTVGIDLVAMNVNDLIVQGASPMFFLDYIAAHKLDVAKMTSLLEGITEGCRQSGAALLGGETSEMPSMYPEGHYDLAGFAVGIVDKRKIIIGKAIEVGDVILGLASDGIHSNGYSLVRKIFRDANYSYDRELDDCDCSLGEELLRPTRIYVRPVLNVLAGYTRKQAVHGIVNITGGGLTENVPRILAEGLCARIDRKRWEVPPIFKIMQSLGNVEREEMYRVFNMGIGMCMILPKYYAEAVIARLAKDDVDARVIGAIVKGKRGVEYVN